MRNNIVQPLYNHYIGLPSEDSLFNPLTDVSAHLKEKDELTEFYKLCNEYYSPEFGIKYLLGMNLYPFQMAAVRGILNHKFPLLLFTRGGGKTLLLAVYAIYHAIMFPGQKVVLVSASFRQSKLIFSEIQKMYDRSPLLQMISEDKPRISTDNCHYYLMGSSIKALPLGTGDKIRGERGHIILCDEFNSVPIEIFDVVVRGFAATESDPFAKTRDKLLRLHKEQANNVPKDDDISDIMLSEGNKIVLSGTAGFKGGTFYQVYKQYLAIIRNGVKGKIGDYTELFEDDIGLHEDVEVDSSDYCIMRYTYKDLLTCRMQDKKVIENAKQTMPDALFRMEYMCFMEYTPIITDSGIKKIRDVQPGDKVLTHKGRFRPVKNSIKQQYSGNMIRYKTWGCNQEYIATATHPYWQKDDKWLSITDICEKDSRRTYLANLKELTSKIQIDVRNFTKNYTERKDRVFPKCSQTILSNKQVQDILSSTKSKKELSEMYGVSLTTIYDVYYLQKNMPKGAIPRNIKLDYNFGVIVGYYASEGSIGSRGRSCSFSLDGHICQDLKVYIDQLEACINEVFGIKTKVYKRDNDANVVINNRIVSDLMSAVCPGVAHTKFVQPDILFSNEEFMKGFIVGYWNGDGHVSGLNMATKSNSASQNLLFQVKSVLSYFGIVSCFRHLKSAGRTVIKGKEYNTKDQFSVEMHGSNAQKFREIFYEDKNTFSDSKYYYNDGNASVFHIKEFNKFPYSGSVYNLEVEEDNSFSLPNATVHNSEFADDSLGFFKPRDIESATCRPGTGFGVQLRGVGKRHYIMGVDPAKTHDRFAIIIIELGTPNKIVYCWTMADSERTYTTGAKKIRELLRKFNIIAIAMDEGGGGLAIEEMINYPSLMEDTENKIYRHDDETPEAKNGNRMLYMFAFNSNWIDDANTLLQKNIEDKVIMFPRAQADTEGSQESFAHKDDAAFEILELKKELVSIEVNYSKTGRKQFNLAPPDPQKDIDGAVRHKDRYSALLLGNYVASRLDKINYDELDFARKNFYDTIKHAGWADDLAEQGDFIMD